MNLKKKKTRIVIAIVAAAVLALVVSVCAVPVSSYFSGMNAPLPEVVTAEEVPESAIAEVITDEEIEKLLSGESSLEDLENSLFEQEQETIAEAVSPEVESVIEEAEPQSEKDASSPAASSTPASSAASSKAASSSSKPAASGSTAAASSAASVSHTSSSASASEPAYEAEVKALVQELYVLRANALADLDACIKSAKAEFHALPEAQQTKTKKISIAFSYAGQLTKLQSYYDKEVDRIVGEMRSTLKANGQSTELADEAMASYKAQKSDMYSSLLKKLYD